MILNGVARKEAILTGLRVATTLGIISPSNNNNDVIITTWNRKPSNGFEEKSRYWFARNVEIITIPTFIKLLAIKMVASSNFEFSSKCTIRLLTAVFDERISFNCDGDNEKNAVSEAEAAAEQSSSIAMVNNPAIRPAEDARSVEVMFNNKNALIASGSGSATVRSN